MDFEALNELKEHIELALDQEVAEAVLENGELSLVIVPDHVVRALKFLRDDARCAFSVLVDICGVDYPGRKKRLEVVYHLLSMTQNLRIRVKLRIAAGGTVPSVVGLFPSAMWYERETYDLFGVVFDGNNDLRRILTDYGFEGHPLRKDFPLSGFNEVRYDDEQKRVIYEPVELVQEFRSFDALSPWEGEQPLPVLEPKSDQGEEA
jgi:NADH-quinone oxidoreductase subunit C